MALFLAALISGLAIGLLYGLIGFSVSILYKSTGVISFAQPAIATLMAFVAYLFLRDTDLPLAVVLALSAMAATAFGFVVYSFAMRPFPERGAFNAVLRTIALSFLIEQFIAYKWSEGEPFPFPLIWSGPSIKIGDVLIPRQNVTTTVVTLILLFVLVAFFTRTRAGLMLRAIADSPAASELLGVDVRRMTAIAWVLSVIVCLVVATLAAPSLLVSTAMFGPFILYGFTAFILGGISTWAGSLVGGLLVGVVSTLGLVYGDVEISALLTFGILLGVLVLRPAGLLGHATTERL